VGFAFRERMHGKFHVLGEPLTERAIEVEIEAHLRDVRNAAASVVGRIRAEGLADNEPVRGKLDLHLLRERRIPYDLAFGDGLRLVGEKELSWLAPVETFETLPFTLIKGPDWTEIARGALRLDVRRDWRSLLRSLRVAPF
jgi:hypothetical protein